MRAVVLVGAFGLLAALLGPQPGQLPPGPDIARDLKLVAASESGRTIEAGTSPWVNLTLVNTSKTFTYPVVKFGDGSEEGLRDPYVYFTAEQLTVDGKWVPMEPSHPGRCGLYDWDWPKDVVDLKPGEQLGVGFSLFGQQYDYQYPGRVRLTGHYEYRAGAAFTGKPWPEADRGRMRGVPVFKLASGPVEFEVVRPLDVRLRVKQPLKVGVDARVSDVIEVTVTNTSDKPRGVGAPSRARDYGLSLMTDTTFVRGSYEATNADLPESFKTLGPGETTTLLGGGGLSGGFDGWWRPERPGKAWVWVRYGLPTGSSARHIINVTAEVTVEP
jgi:hypothetical protein